MKSRAAIFLLVVIFITMFSQSFGLSCYFCYSQDQDCSSGALNDSLVQPCPQPDDTECITAKNNDRMCMNKASAESCSPNSKCTSSDQCCKCETDKCNNV